MSIPSGIYRGRGIAGSEQLGFTSNGNEQIVIDLTIKVPMAGDVEDDVRVSSKLIFASDKQASWNIDRLKTMGWQGTDLSQPLVGIDANEVDVEVSYRSGDGGKQFMDVNVLTGNGRVTVKSKMDDSQRRAFAAKYANLAKASGAAQGQTATQQPLQNTGTTPRF